MAGLREAAREVVVRRTAVPECAWETRATVDEYAAAQGATKDQRDRIALALAEAAANTVVHAYRDRDSPGPIVVEAGVEEGSLVVLVYDEGCGMTPRADSPGLGLGVPLMAQMSDRLEIEAREGTPGVRVRMTFDLRAGRA